MNRYAVALGLLFCCCPSLALADNPGYIGVYVIQVNGGMQISGFIPDTPAAQLARTGELNRRDTIIKLAGRETTSLQRLRTARNSFGVGDEAKMVLRRPDGSRYYVWISRSEGTAYAAAAPDNIHRGGSGEGDEPDVRRKGASDRPAEEGNGDVRPKRD